MWSGAASAGRIEAGGIAFASFSTPSPYDEANANPQEVARYRVEAFPYDPDLPGELTLRWSVEGMPLKLTNPNPETVEQAFFYSSNVSGGELGALTNQTVPSFGTLRVAVAPNEGDTDDFVGWLWGNRPVHVYRGFESIAESEWRRVLTAKVRGRPNVGVHGYTLELVDASVDLAQPMQSSVYAGTGEVEGGEDLTDKRRFAVFGPFKTVAPTKIDQASLVYQIHDQEIQAITSVRDRGIELTSAGDTTDVWSWTQVPGEYRTDLSKGLIRLGATPDGLVTVDGEGHVSPTLGYVDTHAKIAEAILKDYAGVTDTDIDSSSLARLKRQNVGVASWVVPPSEISTIDVLRALLLEIGSVVNYNPLGEIDLVQIRSGVPVLNVRSDEIDDSLGLTSRRSFPPTNDRTMFYQPSYSVQSDEDLADAVEDETAAFVGEPFRKLISSNSVPNHLDAVPTSIETHFETDEGAQNENDRQAALFDGMRDVWEFETTGRIGQIRIGRVIRVEAPRYQFTNGRNGIVLGVEEQGRGEVTKVTWWG